MLQATHSNVYINETAPLPTLPCLQPSWRRLPHRPTPLLRAKQPPLQRRNIDVSFAREAFLGRNIARGMNGRVSTHFHMSRGATFSAVHGGVEDFQMLTFLLADTKERPFKCMKCRSTFVRRDLLLRHDRTVHAKDGGVPLVSEGRRRAGPKSPVAGPAKPSIAIDAATLEQIEASSDGMVDLETAAMLMTDFQHKAAAAAHGHGQDGDGSDPIYSPEHVSLLDPSTSYLSNAALPQIPWDAYISHPPSEPKSHSIASDLSSQDNQMSRSFSNNGTINPNQTQLPPIMERQGSNSKGLAPALQSLTNKLSVNGSPTPHALSPYPSMTGPVSPVNYRRSPGPSQALTQPRAPQVPNDKERDAIADQISNDPAHRALPEAFVLPDTASINRMLSTYFNLFHHHLPFLHQESFQPGVVTPHLLLAVLSIGALYNFDQQQAWILHTASKNLVMESFANMPQFDSRKCPLWIIQSTLLNMIFESWSGSAQGLEWACSMKSLIANVGLFSYSARLCTS